MKIVVFGASGKTGTEIVKQALGKGHLVRAFVRDLNSAAPTGSGPHHGRGRCF